MTGPSKTNRKVPFFPLSRICSQDKRQSFIPPTILNRSGQKDYLTPKCLETSSIVCHTRGKKTPMLPADPRSPATPKVPASG